MQRPTVIATLGVAAYVLSGAALAENHKAPQKITVPNYSHATITVSKRSPPIKVLNHTQPIKVANPPRHPKAARD